MSRYKILGMIAIISLVIAALGVLLYRAQRTTVPRQLTQEERQVYVDRLAEAQQKIATLTEENNTQVNAQALFDAHMVAGAQQFGLGQLAAAENSYEAATKAMPQNSAGWSALGDILTERKKYWQAGEAYAKAVEVSPNAPAVWRRYLNFFEQRQNASLQQVDALYLEALVKTGNHTDILVSYARFKESIGDTQTALNIWKEALKQQPQSNAIQVEIERLQNISGEKK